MWALLLGAILLAASAQAQELPARVQDVPEPAVENEPVAPIGEEEGAPAGEQHAAPEQDGALNLLPAIQGIEAAIRDLVPEENAIEREAERRRNEADLRAQQDMARWAFWTMLAAGASVFLTAVGVYLIWRTLRYTRKAADAAVATVDEARKSTVAAIHTAAAAAESIAISKRGYLFPQNLDMKKMVIRYRDGSPSEEAFVFDFVFKNVGASPSKIIRIVSSYRTIDAAVDPGTIDWTHNVIEPDWQNAIGPENTFRIPEITLTVNDAKRIFSRSHRFFIRMEIRYKNLFEDQSSYHTAQGYEIIIYADPEELYADVAVADLRNYISFQGYAPVSSAS